MVFLQYLCVFAIPSYKAERKGQHVTESEVCHPNEIPQRQADVFSWLNFDKASLRARGRMDMQNC